MIESTLKKLPNSELEVAVSVSWEEWKKYIDQAAGDYSKEIKIQGFRAGKAPRDMVEKKVGTAALFDAAAQKAVQATFPKVVVEKKIEAIGKPKAEIVKLAEGNDLEYKVIVSVIPEVSMKPWKSGVEKVNKEYSKKNAEVTAEDVEKELAEIAKSRVQHLTVEREAQNGDNVILSFEVKKDGVPIENGSSKSHPMILGRGVFIPGFEEQVVGMKAGEVKEFELIFPKEYHEKSLAGNPAQFTVTVETVQERKSPEVTDEFARSLGKFKDLAEMRKNVTEGMEEEKKIELKEKRRGAIIDVLVENTVVEIPHILIHEELHKMIGEFEMQLQGMNITFEQYLKQIGKTIDELEKEWEPQAIKRIKAALALEEVAKEREIEVANEEVEAEMNKTLAQYKKIQDAEKNIDLGKLYNYVKGTMVNEKVLEYLENIK
ncbi:MAG: Trigger factor [Candidatus Moranbacteria bacterium GW2011_GWC2_37_73]|nr:MAG: Trigger factor [Parcubacteria group bacterium GW2011_GWC1_36_108]KKQ01074.1 MAG: Trigger factor [Candidatus Moranbacteria bacterium GW2011_GWD1_36_198]KKQ02476.1 MAG: Trigger factor [Candidatus Moranbacteria bacterium GW2011_GWD2_36_198]KKQ40134.1 MAG: Trigger factor [Candidatus Moranbacteria bacterium GW2011_GWC2_37_73]HAS00246.1 trigger factor [Candidatus Moranbacteria bacterium]